MKHTLRSATATAVGTQLLRTPTHGQYVVERTWDGLEIVFTFKKNADMTTMNVASTGNLQESAKSPPRNQGRSLLGYAIGVWSCIQGETQLRYTIPWAFENRVSYAN